MTERLDEARAELRARQGSGARYDAADAPARDLDWARRGTAYFARLLNDLSDDDLDAPSAIAGLSRRHIVSHVGYHARVLSEIIAWARTGQKKPFPRAAEVAADDFQLGISLPSHALRYLFQHSEIHLNVEWRDLSGDNWGESVVDADGRTINIRETPAIRASALWLHAFDLDAGGRFGDFPADFIDEVIRHRASGLTHGISAVLEPSDRTEKITIGKAPSAKITGRAADLARWLSGRGASGLSVMTGNLPTIEPAKYLVGI